MADPDAPPGWEASPSRWSERGPIIGLAALGFGMATYLTFYQLGIIDSVWEPFFGDGSERILRSDFSKSLPIPDASLGALAYLIDAVGTAIGGRDRWRTRPYLVLGVGLVIALAALGGLGLAAAQPLAFGAGCTLCLTSTLISVALAWLDRREPIAAWQHLRRGTNPQKVGTS